MFRSSRNYSALVLSFLMPCFLRYFVLVALFPKTVENAEILLINSGLPLWKDEMADVSIERYFDRENNIEAEGLW